MAWITYDYRCVDCTVVEIQMVDRDSVPQLLPCPHCGGLAARQTSSSIVLRESYPDGTRRFGTLRQQRELQKVEKKARKKGDRITQAKAAQELKKL